MKQENIVIYKTWQINIPEEFITQLSIREGNTLSCQGFQAYNAPKGVPDTVLRQYVCIKERRADYFSK